MKIFLNLDLDQFGEVKWKMKSIINILINFLKEVEGGEEEEEEMEEEEEKVYEVFFFVEIQKFFKFFFKFFYKFVFKVIIFSRNLILNDGLSEFISCIFIVVMKQKSFDFILSEKGDFFFKGVF